MFDFEMLNKLIKEKLSKSSPDGEVNEINPFYVSKEEVGLLLEREYFEEETLLRRKKNA